MEKNALDSEPREKSVVEDCRYSKHSRRGV